jgi:DNA polymerase III delta prime subunit
VIDLFFRADLKNLFMTAIDPKIKSYLERLANSGSRPGSYIFVGAGEVEKDEAAFYFVSKIAGKFGNGDFLAKIKSKNHPDVVIIEPEIEEKKGKTREKEISISQIRDSLERLKFFPYELKTKFCVIKRAQKMNAEAANALLKSLEEPSASAIFILLADNLESLLPTIVSRCATLRFAQIRLPEWNEENREQLKNIFRQEIFERFDYIEKISKNKNEMMAALKDWELVIAESLRKLVGGNEDRRKIGKVIELVEDTREAINRLERTNANARGVGEKLVLSL